jgi:hypothetical protein
MKVLSSAEKGPTRVSKFCTLFPGILYRGTAEVRLTNGSPTQVLNVTRHFWIKSFSLLSERFSVAFFFILWCTDYSIYHSCLSFVYIIYFLKCVSHIDSNTNIMFLDIIHLVLSLSKTSSCLCFKTQRFGDGFCLRLQVKPTQLGPI